MRSGPITIPDVAGPVLVDTNFWTGKQSVTVADVPVPSSGRRRFLLPTVDGSAAEAKVTSTLFAPYPTIDINGVKHLTGPALPTLLKILLILPIGLAGIGAVPGALIGAVGIVANSTIARGSASTTVKALYMLGVLVGAIVVWALVHDAIVGAVNS